MYLHKCLQLLIIIFLFFPRRIAANAVFKIASHLRTLRKFKNLEWLTVIPLFDFLKEYSQPFKRPEMNPEKIHWEGNREEELELYTLKGKATPGYVHIESHS